SDVEFETILDLPGIATSSNNEFVSCALGIIEEHLGTSQTAQSAPYFTDGSILKPALGNIPTIILGPGDPAIAHKTDEYCDVEEILSAAHVYLRILSSA